MTRAAAVAAVEHAPLMEDGAAKARVIGRALAWSQRVLAPRDFTGLGLGAQGVKAIGRVMKGLVREELVEPATGRGQAVTWRSRVYVAPRRGGAQLNLWGHQ